MKDQIFEDVSSWCVGFSLKIVLTYLNILMLSSAFKLFACISLKPKISCLNYAPKNRNPSNTVNRIVRAKNIRSFSYKIAKLDQLLWIVVTSICLHYRLILYVTICLVPRQSRFYRTLVFAIWVVKTWALVVSPFPFCNEFHTWRRNVLCVRNILYLVFEVVYPLSVSDNYQCFWYWV